MPSHKPDFRGAMGHTLIGAARFGACIAVALLVLSAGASAQVPLGTTFTYQGQLKNASGPANGLHDLQFRLYDAASGGSQIGTAQCADNVGVVDGLFVVALDFGQQFAGQQRFLEVDVRANTGLGCGNPTGFVTLAPRQPLTAVPNALFALSASTAATATNATQLNGQAGAFYQNASNINSGTLADARLTANVALLGSAQTFTGAKTFSTAPAFTAAGSPFSVSATGLVTNLNADLLDGLNSSAFLQSIPVPLTLSGTSATHIIRGENASAANFCSGVFGLATDLTARSYGVAGQSNSQEARAVYGYAPAVTGITFGGWFESDSASGTGVYGTATRPTGVTYGVVGASFSPRGRGVAGYAANLSGNTYGVYGESRSPVGVGVFGLATATPTGQDENYGVWGEASATSGYTYGLWGEVASTAGTGGLGCATATTGFTWGLVGLSHSSGGTGVYGSARASGGTTYGVWGTSFSAAGYGVYGSVSGGTQNAGVYGNSSAFNGNGIIGEALSGGSAFGLWAKAPQGTGVYCQGALTVTGSKAFRIDHPFDPENKYLIHYCSEGPEPLNVYRGNVVTDASGHAVIALPSYFEEINRDVSYQLTVIDNSDDFVLAKVVEGVKDNSFMVRTSKPNVRVSWEVKGVRNDLYTRHYGAPVEVDKTDKDQGTYQHPELYGQPKERMFGYVPEGRPQGLAKQ